MLPHIVRRAVLRGASAVSRPARSLPEWGAVSSQIARQFSSRSCAAAQSSSTHTTNAEAPTTELPPPAFFVRTHTCGTLRKPLAGTDVTLCGWLGPLRSFGGLLFFTIRDAEGTVQCVVKDGATGPPARAVEGMTRESVVRVKGKVIERPPGEVNPKMRTGEVEVEVESVELLNAASGVPFFVGPKDPVQHDDVRLRHRYVDLRRDTLQHNIRFRSKVAHAVRQCLHDEGFCEIETPLLFKSTPEGAREFLVPTRTRGKFYALPQSPQQYKQLLMVGGFEKYFQIARCFRDEGARSDRQPEFTQVDLEMSFVTKDDVRALVERLLAKVWKSCLGQDLKLPMRRITLAEAMERYGIDKPDTRFGMELTNLTDICAAEPSSFVTNALQNGGGIVAICCPGLAALSRKQIEGMVDDQRTASEEGQIVLALKVEASGGTSGPGAKHFSAKQQSDLVARLSAKAGDLILVCAGPRTPCLSTLGRLRLKAAALCWERGALPRPAADRFDFLWVEDFPLFEQTSTKEGRTLLPTHHPFTAPHPEDVEMMAMAPERVRGQHYDIVLNGTELGGGSIRIHDAAMQRNVLENALRLPPHGVARFEHLMAALSHGCPPHGGIALGFDRMVAVMLGAASLRDVIAFPKTTAGAELMTGSPDLPTPTQLAEYHITVAGEPPSS